MATAVGKLLLLGVLLTALIATATAMADDFMVGWVPRKSECRGTIAECEAMAEFEVGSEFSRRILAGGNYISYNALKRDTTPCSRRGASYYNCRPGAQANPYRRGCSRITGCRG